MMDVFLNFPNLPPELRNKVWRDTLPDEVGPFLFFYRKRGCWCVRRLEESERGYVKDIGGFAMEFRTDLLGNDNRFRVPLVAVNREARRIAFSWLEEQGFQMESLRHEQYVFTRPFNRALDVLYIADGTFYDFYAEPRERFGEPDLVAQRVSVVKPTVTRFAVSEKFFTRSEAASWLPGVSVWMDPRVVFVVVGKQPHGRPGTRWMLEGTDGGAFIFNKQTEHFEFRQGAVGVGDEDVCRKMGEAARVNSLKGMMNFNNSLEIRPVTVARRLHELV